MGDAIKIQVFVELLENPGKPIVFFFNIFYADDEKKEDLSVLEDFDIFLSQLLRKPY